jgi:hypothetical protein
MSCVQSTQMLRIACKGSALAFLGQRFIVTHHEDRIKQNGHSLRAGTWPACIDLSEWAG